MPILKTSNVLTAMDAVLRVPEETAILPVRPGRTWLRRSIYPGPGAHAVLSLYQRDQCHLCDLALAVLAQARCPDFAAVFIDDDAGLEQRYGARVPVLHDARDGRELDWPFDADAVRAWLHAAA